MKPEDNIIAQAERQTIDRLRKEVDELLLKEGYKLDSAFAQNYNSLFCVPIIRKLQPNERKDDPAK